MTAESGPTAVAWDYSRLARPYLKRPDYSGPGLDAALAIAGLPPRAAACDVGAGIGHLSIPLARRGLRVAAVEPNDAMRAIGAERTASVPGIEWHAGTGESTGRPSGAFDIVTFGSSFNVTDRALAMRETVRLLKPGGWFCCMWNHRDLDDPIQREVERIIAGFVPGFDYGTRREDQTPVIVGSGLFEPPFRIEAPVLHAVDAGEWVEAWNSHATLDRQSGGRMREIVEAIRGYVAGLGRERLVVPYVTRIWVARARA
jgi:ubiquinone/menaquinone biosynthesis C-methylase UbiE